MTDEPDAALDPDDPRPPYVQVATRLRAAILTGRVAPGERLPSQTELAKRYGVARMTVQQALRLLKDEYLVVSRQGSGVFARQRMERPVGIRPHIEAAFTEDAVTIDFAGYTGETLAGSLLEPIDKIRDGRLHPSTITLRMMLADMSRPIAIPSRAGETPGDDPRIRQRMAKTTDRYAGGLAESLNELQQLGLVAEVQVAIRVHSAAPLFKLYLINHHEAFIGFYPVHTRTLTISGEAVPAFDVLGKDAHLFHHSADTDPESLGSLYVTEMENWFESVWHTIARPWQP
ncbi:GntR family transcriptional regulator [Micropruina sonneratiae]|uniref:GntR family transcriptional regulator n=1 Tax=Micropruina sonneratiae TaxID=2986940 RepID=UPI002227DFAE|nr:GntR family transcriptional regulator [Micropruina sp. KQZ13P-5]MCW3158634.1 GntR family transcriptional regulator [Micropruina sp. KQZ13P-5]